MTRGHHIPAPTSGGPDAPANRINTEQDSTDMNKSPDRVPLQAHDTPARRRQDSGTGLFISFLGVDGIGKTTLSRAVGEHLESRGFTVRHIAWRQLLAGESRQWPGESLQQLWVEAFRLLFAGGERDGQPLRMPRDYPSWNQAGWEEALKDSRVSGVRAVGPLAAALVELAANMVIAAEEIQPALARGEVVLQESFPFKHVVKELLIAQRIAGIESQWSPITQLMQAFFQSIFSAFPLRPDIGILVDGPIDLAYRWRMAQSGNLGVLEDYGAAGEKGQEAFTHLQTQTAAIFRDSAQNWGWLIHHVDDHGLDRNIDRGLDLIVNHPEYERLGTGS